MKVFKSLTIVVLLLVGVVVTACGGSAPAADTTTTGNEQAVSYAGKKVLLVDSYHEGYSNSDEVIAAVRKEFEGTGIELKVMHMDAKNHPEEESLKKAAKAAKDEIDSFKPDVVIATEDDAQKYLVVPYLKNTDLPVVFVGVNWDATPYGYPAKNVTGSLEVELIQQLVDHLKEFAKGDRIAYLAIDTTTEQKAVEIYQKRFFDGKLDVHLVKTFDEYKTAFIDLQGEADILLLGNFAGADRWDEDEAKKLFQTYTRIPTGTVRTQTETYGLISLVKIRAEDGEWAGQTVLKILGGTPISDIPMTENKRGELVLNLDIAKKLGVVFPPSLVRNATRVYGGQ